MCRRQSRKIIWDTINHCSWHCSCRTYFCYLPLALANIYPWPLVPFSQISLKNSELKTGQNSFRDCRLHFFRQPFSKYLYQFCCKLMKLSHFGAAEFFWLVQNLGNVMILIYSYTFYRFPANWMSYSRFHDSPEGAVYFPQILLLHSTSHVYQGLYSRIFYLSVLVSPRFPVQWKLMWADTLVTQKRCL